MESGFKCCWGIFYCLRIIYCVTVLKTRKKKLSFEGSDLRIFKERMYFCLSNKEVEMYTMKSKLYREREKIARVSSGEGRMRKEIDDFKELMYWASNEKIGKMTGVVSN